MALPNHSHPNRIPLFPAPPSGSPVKPKLDDQFYKEFSRAIELSKADIRLRDASPHSHFNSNQPRVSSGHSDGGQWTSSGEGRASSEYLGRNGAQPVALPGQVMSDADPDPVRVWSQYAQAGVGQNSQNPAVERTKDILTDILLGVNRRVAAEAQSNPISARLYGIFVHRDFANAVRAQDLPGIGRDGVEQSFNGLGEIVRYGLDASIRTDIVLRDRSGRIIAIFDVKTGNAAMAPATAKRYRRHTQVGPEVPIIILHAVRGAGLW